MEDLKNVNPEDRELIIKNREYAKGLSDTELAVELESLKPYRKSSRELFEIALRLIAVHTEFSKRNLKEIL